jgi:hypothetical protein
MCRTTSELDGKAASSGNRGSHKRYKYHASENRVILASRKRTGVTDTSTIALEDARKMDKKSSFVKEFDIHIRLEASSTSEYPSVGLRSIWTRPMPGAGSLKHRGRSLSVPTTGKKC